MFLEKNVIISDSFVVPYVLRLPNWVFRDSDFYIFFQKNWTWKCFQLLAFDFTRRSRIFIDALYKRYCPVVVVYPKKE